MVSGLYYCYLDYRKELDMRGNRLALSAALIVVGILLTAAQRDARNPLAIISFQMNLKWVGDTDVPGVGAVAPR